MLNKIQAEIKNNPPIGVIKPMVLKLIPVTSIVANKYIEPEKNRIPKKVNIKIVFFTLKESSEYIPTKSKNNA